MLFDRLRLPAPVLQREVVLDGGAVARADYAWEEHGVLGEFDGRVEYGRLLRPGRDPGDVVLADERREDEMRDAGWGVVRWVRADLADPDRLGARIRRALQRGRR